MVVEPNNLRIRVHDKCDNHNDNWNPCPGTLQFKGLLCETVDYYIVEAQCPICGKMYEFKRRMAIRQESELRDPTLEE